MLSLLGCSVRIVSPQDLCFQLVIPLHNKSYYLFAANETQLDEWVSCLLVLADSVRLRSISTHLTSLVRTTYNTLHTTLHNTTHGTSGEHDIWCQHCGPNWKVEQIGPQLTHCQLSQELGKQFMFSGRCTTEFIGSISWTAGETQCCRDVYYPAQCSKIWCLSLSLSHTHTHTLTITFLSSSQNVSPKWKRKPIFINFVNWWTKPSWPLINAKISEQPET